MPSTFSSWFRSVICLAISIYKKTWNLTQDFGSNPKFLLYDFFFWCLDYRKKIQMNGKNMAIKCIISLQIFSKLVQGSQRYKQKGSFWKRPHDTPFMSYKFKSWGKRSRLVLYRWKLAEIGGNWLILAKYGFHHRKWVENPAQNWIFVLFFLWSI